VGEEVAVVQVVVSVVEEVVLMEDPVVEVLDGVFEEDAEVEVVLRQVKSRCGSKCRGAGVE
jgi:hypothetical protein